MPTVYPVRRTRHISWAPSGWLVGITTERLCTDFVTLTCPDDFLAVRAGFANINPEPYHVTKVIAAASTTLSDHVNPTGVSFWRSLTFANDGVAVDEIVASSDAPTAITVRGCPRHPSANGFAVPSWTWTDWTPVSSLPQRDKPNAPRVLMIRVLLPEGCRRTTTNGGFMEFHGTPAMNLGSSYVAGQVPLDVVTVPETVSALGANLGIAFPSIGCVQFLTRNEGVVGVTAGDSHHQGASTTTQHWNYLLRSTVELNARYAGQTPFGYWAAARGGATSGWFFSCLTNILPIARPGFVVLPGWSYNDQTLTEHADHAANLIFLSRLMIAAEACARAGAVPIFLTPFPRDRAAMSPIQVSAWRMLYESICALRANGAIVLDATSILANRSNEAMDGTYRAGYSDDAAHPNNAGHAAIASVLTPMIERICGLTQAPDKG
jgi:hypothetical protein